MISIVHLIFNLTVDKAIFSQTNNYLHALVNAISHQSNVWHLVGKTASFEVSLRIFLDSTVRMVFQE